MSNEEVNAGEPLSLGELVNVLEAAVESGAGDRVIRYGFGSPNSWRGSYSELAFDPERDVTIRSMLDHARGADGRQFEGYKGGKYTMSASTLCHVARYGECPDGDSVTYGLLEWMGIAAASSYLSLWDRRRWVRRTESARLLDESEAPGAAPADAFVSELRSRLRRDRTSNPRRGPERRGKQAPNA